MRNLFVKPGEGRRNEVQGQNSCDMRIRLDNRATDPPSKIPLQALGLTPFQRITLTPSLLVFLPG
jgi:hypothetical protein